MLVFEYFYENEEERTNRATKRLSENLGLLHFRTVHLRPDHRAERHLRAQLVRYGQCERGLARARRADEEQRAAGKFARFYEVDDDAACLDRAVSSTLLSLKKMWV